MRVTCNYDRTKWDHKPVDQEVGYVQRKLERPEEIDTRDLAELLVFGGNMRIVACNGGSGNNDFVSGQLIGLDCDNEHSERIGNTSVKVLAEKILFPEDVRRTLEKNGIKVHFQYETWSSTPEHPKFRTIIALDRPVTDINEYSALVLHLVNLFGKDYADRRAETVSRVFFGSGAGKVEFADYDAVNDTDEILSRCEIVDRTPREKTRTKKRRGRRTGDTANQRVVEAIQSHDVDYLKRHIGNRRTTFDTTKELYDFIYRIPLDEFLGVDAGTTFRCILPDHEDRNPSANVFKTTSGIWKYKCFGCETVMNIKQMIEVLGNFRSEYQAIKFICAVFNLKVRKTEWSEEQLENIDRILHCITAGGDAEEAFSNICPTAAKVTRNAIGTYIQILIQAKQTIYPEKTGDGNVIFYLSTRKLASAAEKRSPAQVQAYIKQLVYCRMLEILDDSQIPQQMLIKARSVQQEKQKRTTFFQIPSWVFARTALIDRYGARWREQGYRIRGLSYEMFYRSEPEEAARLYPDSKTRVIGNGKVVQRTTTKKADDRHMEISQIVISEIQKNGYCTEKKILDFAKNKSLTELQISRSIMDICRSYGFKKCRSNKALKALYNIPGNGYPNIIIEDA